MARQAKSAKKKRERHHFVSFVFLVVRQTLIHFAAKNPNPGSLGSIGTPFFGNRHNLFFLDNRVHEICSVKFVPSLLFVRKFLTEKSEIGQLTPFYPGGIVSIY